jgi:hypothetical protein
MQNLFHSQILCTRLIEQVVSELRDSSFRFNRDRRVLQLPLLFLIADARNIIIHLTVLIKGHERYDASDVPQTVLHEQIHHF